MSDRDPGVDPVWCIVVAGGSGRRFGGAKQWVELAGATVVERSVATAAAVCDGVVVVVPAGDLDAADIEGATQVVAGGDSRSASVRAGLAAVPEEAAVVLVHDAARPLADRALFERVVDAVRGGADVAIPVVAVSDTIRHVDGGVVDRDDLRAVQTPQGFAARALRSVHVGEPDATDDAGLVEAAGGSVALVDGQPSNLKLTDPHDLVVAEALLAAGPAAGAPTAGAPTAGAPTGPAGGSPDDEMSTRLH